MNRWLACVSLVLFIGACSEPDGATGDPNPRPGDSDGDTDSDGDGATDEDATTDEDVGDDDPPPPVWPTGGEHDPAPDVSDPGATVTGTGCSGPALETYDLDVGTDSTHTFAGTASGITTDGTFYVYAGPGREITGVLETSSSGTYALSAPLFCGNQVVKLVWEEGGCGLVLVYHVRSTACSKRDLRITLTWDATGRDWELHLVKPAGRINDPATDCTWDTCQTTSPDWGVAGDATDDPVKDVDDITGYGPESIYLPALENGTYTVLVEHWNSAGSPTSDGQVIINLLGTTTVLDRQDLIPSHVWTVATIHGTTVTPVLSSDSRYDYDCTANWSGGCNDAIP